MLENVIFKYGSLPDGFDPSFWGGSILNLGNLGGNNLAFLFNSLQNGGAILTAPVIPDQRC